MLPYYRPGPALRSLQCSWGCRLASKPYRSNGQGLGMGLRRDRDTALNSACVEQVMGREAGERAGRKGREGGVFSAAEPAWCGSFLGLP